MDMTLMLLEQWPCLTPTGVYLKIDYCDERLVYSNDDISVTRGGTYTNNTSIKSPDSSLFNDITW